MAGLKSFGRQLAQLADIPTKILKPIADKVDQAIEQEFEDGKDPHGRKWKPLKRTGRPSHLTETGSLRASAKAIPGTGTTIDIIVEDDKANFHQDGTVNMVARPILPDDNVMPKEWQEAISEEYTAAVSKVMKR